MAARSHLSGAPSGAGSIARAAIRQAIAALSERDPVRRAEPGMRMVRGEPALDGEQQAGEQHQAGSTRVTVPIAPPRTGSEHCRDGEPERAREDRARLAHRSAGDDGEGEVIRIDISVGSVYLAIVPCRDSMNKRPSRQTLPGPDLFRCMRRGRFG